MTERKPRPGDIWNIQFTRKRDGRTVKRRLEVLELFQNNDTPMIRCKTAGTYRTSGWKTYRLEFFLAHAEFLREKGSA